MKWSYDLTGAEMIIKDEPIYDATTIVQGELLMLGTSAFTAGADAGTAFVTGYSATPANAAIDAVGICLETATTAGTTGSTTSIAAAHNVTTGVVCMGKVIVNPFAVYRAEVAQADAITVGAAGSSGTVQFTIAANGTTNQFTGSFVYFCASAGSNYGCIRRIVSNASAATFVLDSAVTATITSADKIILISNKNSYPHNVSADGTTIGQSSTVPNGATNLRVVENLIDRGLGLEILNQKQHSQIKLDSVAAGRAKFYQEIVLKDHVFGTQES
jgi:hypothetical protein